MFCGDFRQTDLEGPRKDGLKKFMGILDKMKEFSHIEMSEEDIVRSGIVRSYIMEKMRNGICS
jgi:phosphate starvation-inducible protein PhoH